MKKIFLVLALISTVSATFAQNFAAKELTFSSKVFLAQTDDSASSADNLYDSSISDSSDSSDLDSADSTSKNSDNSADSEPVKKHYFTAISGMLLFNVLLSTWNRYMIGSGWAKVGWDDVKEFYKKEVKWDRDWYWTNFVLHPYQGSFYYQAARSSNLNQFESLLVTVAGSSIWEWFCERNSPSKNDMVYTTIGSFAVGEMLYRLSVEADQYSRFVANALNPEGIFTSLVTGERPRGTTGNIYELSMKFGAGTARSHTTFENTFKDCNETFPVFANTEVAVVYNDPYGWDSNEPYSQFELTMGGKFGIGSGEGKNDFEENFMRDIYIRSNGMLFSRSPNFGKNVDTTLGLILDYDFSWHSFYELSTLSPGFAIKQRIKHGNSKSEWQLHLDGILLGTTDFYYLHRKKALDPFFDVNPDNGNYDYNHTYGAEAVLKYRFTSKRGNTIDFDFHGYAMKAFENQLFEGCVPGWELFAIAYLNAEIPVTEKLNLGFGNEVYVKQTFYDDVPDVFSVMYTGSLFARWKFM